MINSRKLKFKIIEEHIRKKIKSGRLGPGDRLPPEQALAKELNAAPLTIRRGLAELESEGLIIKIHRVGTFVKDTPMLNRTAIIFPKYLFDGNYQLPATSLTIIGVNQALDSRQYSISTFSFAPGRLWADAGQLLVEQGFRGVLLWADSTVKPGEVKRLLQAGINVVLLWKRPELTGLGLINVSVDRTMALTQIMTRLYEDGHRQIIVGLYTVNPFRWQQKELLNSIFKQWGIRAYGDFIFDIPNPPNGVDYSVIPRLFDKPLLPTAVVVPDERIASEIFRLCYERNIQVPNELSIASLVDNTPQAHPVPLTAPDSVKLGIQSAKLAAEYLAKLMAGEKPLEKEINIGCDIQWKTSTDITQKGGK